MPDMLAAISNETIYLVLAVVALICLLVWLFGRR